MARRKSITNIDKVIEIYYTKPELTTSDIMEMFNISKTTAYRYMVDIREGMKKANILSNRIYAVDTVFAYKHLGIDIKRLEMCHKKLKELDLERS